MPLTELQQVAANKLKYKEVYHSKGFGRIEYAGTMGDFDVGFRKKQFKFYDMNRNELFWTVEEVMRQLPWLFRRDECEPNQKPVEPEAQVVMNTLQPHFQYKRVDGRQEDLIYQGMLNACNVTLFFFTGAQSNLNYYWSAKMVQTYLAIFQQQEVEMAKDTEDPQYKTLGQKVQETLNPSEPWNLVFAYGSRECEALELLGFKCLGGGRDEHDRQVMVFEIKKPLSKEK